jgi:hypothetical protein
MRGGSKSFKVLFFCYLLYPGINFMFVSFSLLYVISVRQSSKQLQCVCVCVCVWYKYTNREATEVKHVLRSRLQSQTAGFFFLTSWTNSVCLSASVYVRMWASSAPITINIILSRKEKMGGGLGSYRLRSGNQLHFFSLLKFFFLFLWMSVVSGCCCSRIHHPTRIFRQGTYTHTQRESTYQISPIDVYIYHRAAH